MTESPADILPELPLPRSMRNFRDATIDLARRLDPFVAFIEDEQGYGRVIIEFRRGIADKVEIHRSYKLG